MTLTVENAGDADVLFVAGGMQRGDRDNQFAFIAHSQSGFGKAVRDTGDPCQLRDAAASDGTFDICSRVRRGPC